MGRTCSMCRTIQKCTQNLVEKLEGKRPLGRPRRRWEDNTNVELREVGSDPGDRIDLAQDRDQ